MWTNGNHSLPKFCLWTWREPNNPEDEFAVAIKRCGDHIPFNLAPITFLFLKRGVNKGLFEVTGVKVWGHWWSHG